MFNHDIEVNFNLNRMGVAWFQQHSPKTIAHRAQKNSNNSLPGLDASCSSSGGGIGYQCHTPTKQSTTSYENNVRRDTTNQYPNDARKTPIKLHESKRFRQMHGSWNKSRDEEPLELVDLIDIEDEDHSFSAFFVGMNNNGLPSSSQSTNSQHRNKNNNSNNHIINTIVQQPIQYSPSNKSSCNLGNSNTLQRHAVLQGATSLSYPISTNSTPTTATIINAVNTINISNNQVKRNLVNKIVQGYSIILNRARNMNI